MPKPTLIVRLAVTPADKPLARTLPDQRMPQIGPKTMRLLRAAARKGPGR